jgi:1-acyl-sn-glycerol-3-phosphate acyltransferase
MRTMSSSDVAIVGIGCRFPGGANSPDAFWKLLQSGVDAITDVPADRPELLRFYDPDPATPGRLYLRRGGFMDRIDGWDAGFFGISPREAAHIDPQHRLLLEVVWEALEDAGIPPDQLAGSRTGVFIGISTHDYADLHSHPHQFDQIGIHSNSGVATSIAANRISYLYDFRGPSFTVDTACSSSLTALHLACRSIRDGESDLAVAGGVQLHLNPALTIGFCKASMLSPSGECRAFDASANGYSRGEGTGVVVLKPLEKALADSDPIYAVVAGTAINQDGHTTGMTVPSAAAQAAGLREALRHAGIDAADVDYVEAHGTGTPVGDPIEASAIAAVFGAGRTAPLPIGSVKTNIGHLEAASGVAGLIKAALAIKHRALPPSLHFTTANPMIDMAASGIRVVTRLEPWPNDQHAATAVVNSFGFGGSNAHAVLTEAPWRAREPESGKPEANAVLLPLSARSADALIATARSYVGHLAAATDSLGDSASAAAMRRAQHEHRLAIVASTKAEAIEVLEGHVSGEARSALATGRAAAHKLAFVFSGMGPQWWGMGRQLRAESPIFRDAIERCHEALRPHAPWGLIDELSRDEKSSRIAEPALAQVTNFAIQVAIVAQLEQWGIGPDAVVGHSAGEMAAAYASGALSLEDAVCVSYHRSRLQEHANPGRILAVALSPSAAERVIQGFEDEVGIAAINSPISCTLAGGAAALERIDQRLQGEQIFTRFLNFDRPYHCQKMDPIRGELVAALARIEARSERLPLVSTVTASWMPGAAANADYWWRNVRQPVRFADAITTLIDGGYDTFLEVSPHPVLSVSIAECLAARAAKGKVVATLRRKEDERAALLRSAGALWALGRPIRWAALQDGPSAHVDLPGYPWQRERHWLESAPDTGDWHGEPSTNGTRRHPLLGRRLTTAHATWESSLGGERLAYLEDHVLQGTVILPGAAYAEMALAAAAELQGRPAVRDVEFKQALAMPKRADTIVQLATSAKGDRFEILSATRADRSRWTLNASGTLGASPAEAEPIDLDALRARLTSERDREETYAALKRRGMEYGPAFRGIEQLWTGSGEALGRIRAAVAAPGITVDGLHTHPALVDAAFQVMIAAVASVAGNTPGLYLPVKLEEFVVHAPLGDAFWSHVRLLESAEDMIVGDITMLDDAGTVLAAVRGFNCKRLGAGNTEPNDSLEDWLYEYRWEHRPLAITSTNEQGLAADASKIADAVRPVAERLVAGDEPLNDYFNSVEPALERLTCAYMVRALRKLGWAMAVGERVETDALLDALGVVASRRRLARSLLGWLADAGVFRREGNSWQLLRVPEESDPDAMERALVGEYPSFEIECGLVARCGTRLAEVLNGKVDAVREIFFADGGYEFMGRFYREAVVCRYYQVGVAEVIAAALETGPPDGRVRVLELGGGTAGTTGYVLDKLPAHRLEYLFTDISPRFTRAAAERFASHPHLQCRPVDVERDFASQGVAGQFDIVIASDVLHGMASIAGALANIRNVLAPGGMLVLLEITRPKAWVDLVFGMTDGWWRFTDHDVRPDYPLLTPSQWHRALERAGFASVGMVAERYDDLAGQSVLVASKSEALPAAAPRVETPVLVFADRGGASDSLVRDLESMGAQCISALASEREERVDASHFALPPDDAGAVTRLLDALAAEGTTPRALVYLWALDVPQPNDVPADRILDTQAVASRGALAVAQAVARRADPGTTELWFVTANAQAPHAGEVEPQSVYQAPVWGLARSVMRERPDVRCRLVDLGQATSARETMALAREILRGEWEQELALWDGERRVRRLHRVQLAKHEAERRRAAPGEGFRAHIETPGSLGTLCLRSIERRPPAPGEVAIQVDAVSLNFREVMLAMGMLPTAATKGTFGGDLLGFDCAGTIVGIGDGVAGFDIGDSVVGGARGALASYVTTPAELVAHRPPSLSAEEAAGIPTTFVTAYYSLVSLARLQPGERVLIHAATGGVGLAAIQIARAIGAEVYATAGSAAKREYLASLGVEHIMDSRSLRFADEIMARTRGAGVDVVLNSLAGEAIAKGISVLAPYGRFVEIGKRDIYQDSQIGLLAFQNNISFFAVDLDRLCADRIGVAGSLMKEITERLRDGTYRALPIEVFPISRLEAAMRHLAQAKHIGKVVLTLNDADAEVVHSTERTPLCRRDGTYLVVGGLGNVGLALADWLASEGAGALALMGRSGAEGAAAERVEQLRATGVRVEVIRGDVSVGADIRRVLDQIRSTMPPLRGVFHAAMVIDDADILELDRTRMDSVLAPKLAGAWHLHEHTLNDPLEHFVLFSSLVGLFGSPRQANYGAANAFLDSLANHRRALGLPALAVDWGAFGQLGYVARHKEVADYLDKQGYYGFTTAQMLEALGAIMRSEARNLMAALIDWQRWVTYSPTAGAAPAIREFAARDKTAAQTTSAGGAGSAAFEARATILAAEPARRRELVDTYLREKVAKVLGIAPSRLDDQAPLTGMGFDSLIAVELMTVLKMELGVELPVVKLLQGVSLAGLSALVIEQLPLGDGEIAPAPTPPQPTPLETPIAETNGHAPEAIVMAENATAPEAAAAVEYVKAQPVDVPPGDHAGQRPSNGNGRGIARHLDYATIDYSQWSPKQRVGRAAVVASLRTLMKLDVKGREHLPRSGPYLITCNHLHQLDSMVLFSVLERRTVIYAAEYLQHSAFTNWVLGDMGQAIFVKRGEADLEALELGLTVLRSGGVLGIGPEGTRSKTGALGPGRAGAAYIATRVDVPIVPIVAWGQERAPSQWKRLRRPEVNVRIGQPLRLPQGETSVADLQRHTDRIMFALADLLPEEYRGVYRKD